MIYHRNIQNWAYALQKSTIFIKIWILPWKIAVGWDFKIASFFQNPFSPKSNESGINRLVNQTVENKKNRKWVIERPWYWSKVKWSDFYLFLELYKMEKLRIHIIPDLSHKRGMIIRISGTKSKKWGCSSS